MEQNRFTPIVAHLAGWIFFFSLVVGFLYNSAGTINPFAIIFSWSFLVFSTTYLFLFYVNTYILIPELYLKRKILLYVLVVAVLFVLVYIAKPFDGLMSEFGRPGPGPGPMQGPPDFIPGMGPGGPPPPGDGPGPGGPPPPGSSAGHTDIVSIILFVTVWSLSAAICIIRQWRVTEKRAIQAEADKANAELSFLKAQINPHFLFNTLNNIYSLAISRNENTAESIMKLSNIMRYVTDDVRQDFVSLENEVECVRDYIDLQRLRLGKKAYVDFTVTGNLDNKKIAPLVLMSFIENVFKYGVSSHEESVISIKIATEGKDIRFFCQNRLFETKRNAERTGIGIENTRQRLQHLYPHRHLLSINAGNGLFTVQLTLQDVT